MDFDNFFFFFPFFGLKQPGFRKKVFFCLLVRGVYAPYTLNGQTTKKNTFFMCVSPKLIIIFNIFIFFRAGWFWRNPSKSRLLMLLCHLDHQQEQLHSYVHRPRRIQDRWRVHLVRTTLYQGKISMYYWIRSKSTRVERYNIVHQYGKQEGIIHPYFALVQGSSH